MPITKENKGEIVKDFGASLKDTGSAEVQIALLTQRINHLSLHLKEFKKDHSSRRGLLCLVGKRRSLLNYLRSKDEKQCKKVMKKLKLRGWEK